MSLHATPTDEAQYRLNAQRRNSTISSIAITLLAIALTALTLAYLILPSLVRENPPIVTYSRGAENTEPAEQPRKQPSVSRKPSAPSSSAARVISVNTESPVAIPVPEYTPSEASVDFGNGNDFGDGWTGASEGDGGGKGSGFGSDGEIRGALKGCLYDFKQRSDGKPLPYQADKREEFVDKAVKVQRNRFEENAFARYFRAPKELYLTHLAIPFSPAQTGPEYFGAKDQIKPTGWMATYRGRIVAPETGTYRLRGVGDDYLVVFVDRRLCLVGCWPDIQPAVAGRWDPGKPSGSLHSPLGTAPLVYGDWINLKAGVPVDIAIGIGERPGGMVGFVLEVEQKGVDHRTDAKGRKILPLFTTHAFTEEQRKQITTDFKDYEFDWSNVPVFGVK
ncbi:MAG: hypothetical protein J0M04_09560 [Verrucomicrobia bacterium]|nr:hypothetical protein [Verrucomicrobiota bacterium]